MLGTGTGQRHRRTKSGNDPSLLDRDTAAQSFEPGRLRSDEGHKSSTFRGTIYDWKRAGTGAICSVLWRAKRAIAFGLAGVIAISMLWLVTSTGLRNGSQRPRVRKDVQVTASHKAVLASDPFENRVQVNPRPHVRHPHGNTGIEDEGYLAYFPHSGYHNQRISLENALTLAHMLNRTLLVPPVWLGHAIPFISFDKMHDRLLQARKDGLEHCKTADASLPTPPECSIGYWDYTIVSWDMLVDMASMDRLQPLVDRWDLSWLWLENNLGIKRDRDVYFVKDEKLYEYRIYDTADDKDALEKFNIRIDAPALTEATRNHRLVHFGSLFGSSRLRLAEAQNIEHRNQARKSMIFKNIHLDGASNAIRDRLGGANSYFGVHLRVGDGVFQQNAHEHARSLFLTLCTRDLLMRPHECESLADESGPDSASGRRRPKRADFSAYESKADLGKEISAVQHNVKDTAGGEKRKRAGSKGSTRKKKRPDPHDELPALGLHTFVEKMPLHPSVKCRSPLHTEDSRLALNTPVFLATDSKSPSSDPALAIFYRNLPCLFTLSDFTGTGNIVTEPVADLLEIVQLVNQEDGVPLAPHFYPLLDAMIASKGRNIVGTPGSTFSRFAVDVLHQAYHGWPVVDRS